MTVEWMDGKKHVIKEEDYTRAAVEDGVIYVYNGLAVIFAAPIRNLRMWRP